MQALYRRPILPVNSDWLKWPVTYDDPWLIWLTNDGAQKGPKRKHEKAEKNFVWTHCKNEAPDWNYLSMKTESILIP